jgi:diguanylate cyclase (GGDEF)-like protein
MKSVNLFNLLEFVPRQLVIPFGVLLQVIVGFLDYSAGYHMSLALFYLVPICFVAVRIGRIAGLIMSVFGAVVLFLVEDSLRPPALQVLVLVWNVVLRWGFFVLAVIILTELQNSLRREEVLSRSDSTTGLANGRHFTEVLETELARLRRYQHPFTMAYIDLDNFKGVNDSYGHTVGDQLLSEVAHTLKEGVRTADTVARLGGDEFAILFPETLQPESRSVLDRLTENVGHLTQSHGWRVTMSVGLVTFNSAPKCPEDVIKAADDLMYSVKHGGKAGIRELSLP